MFSIEFFRGYWRIPDEIKILAVLPNKNRKFESVIMGERVETGNYFTAEWDGGSRHWYHGEYDLDRGEAMQSLLSRAGVNDD